MNRYLIDTYIYRLLTLAIVILSAVALPWTTYAAATDDTPEWRGLVESRPIGTFVGDWMIGGRTFAADSRTQIEEEDGPLAVGFCAEVKYRVAGGGYYAVKLERQESDECGNSDDENGDHDDERYGLIESLPNGSRVGNWTIGGVLYQANINTQFEQEHGGFAVGACVKVKQAGTPPVVTKIETKRAYKCGGDQGGSGGNPSPNPAGKLYGVINTLPATLLGEWRIGTMLIVVDSNTDLEQEHGAFAIGMLVEVNFTTDSNNVYRATKIESKYATEHDGNDDDGNGSHDGNDGHLYGKVEALPTNGLLGEWTIAGLTYTVNAATHIEQEHGALTVGADVKIQYYITANGNRIATKIESTAEADHVTAPEQAKLYGFIQEMPLDTFNGAWVINGITLVADNGTLFEEGHGLLTVGAYVEVETIRRSTEIYAVKIETHVPPGAGMHNHAGEIEANSYSATQRQTSAETTWTIGGRSFRVTPATDLNDSDGALTVGSTVFVNSYTTADGQEVATRIRSVVFTTQVFIPLITR